MSQLVGCDGPECDNVLDAFEATTWLHNGEYHTDFCCEVCNARWWEENPED